MSLRPNWIDLLSEAPRAALTAAMVRRSFAPAALIYCRTEAPEGLYVIRSGSALFCLDGANGKRLLLKVLRENELFGESVALDRLPAPVSAEARTALLTDMVPHYRLDELRGHFSEIDQALARVAAANLRSTLGALEEQALLALPERTIARLALLCREDGAPEKREAPIRLAITQTELAAMLGASRPAVNAELSVLEQRSAIRRGFGWIEVWPERL